MSSQLFDVVSGGKAQVVGHLKACQKGLLLVPL